MSEFPQMRVLICGAGGQVGTALQQYAPTGWQLHALSHSELDITEPQLLQHSCQDIQPHLIINAAAYTAVDLAEQQTERAHAINAEGALHLALAAKSVGAALIHLSTDYVFDGQQATPYKEDDLCAPLNQYGQSKLAGEEHISRIWEQHIILRSSWIFSAQAPNFVNSILRLSHQRDELQVVNDQIGCPTSAKQLAQAIWLIATHLQQHQQLPWGIYHYRGTPACSWYEFAQQIIQRASYLKLLATPPKVTPIPSQDYPTPAQRPHYSILDCQKLQHTLGINSTDWRQDLDQVLLDLHQALPLTRQDMGNFDP